MSTVPTVGETDIKPRVIGDALAQHGSTLTIQYVLMLVTETFVLFICLNASSRNVSLYTSQF